MFLIGNGRYGIYLANYASFGGYAGNGRVERVGAHTILEMDETRSSPDKIHFRIGLMYFSTA